MNSSQILIIARPRSGGFRPVREAGRYEVVGIVLLRRVEADNICPYDRTENFTQAVGADIIRLRVNAVRLYKRREQAPALRSILQLRPLYFVGQGLKVNWP